MWFILFWLLGNAHTEKREEGQGLVEYALIIIFVGVVLIFLLTVLGPGIKNIYANIVNTIQGSS